VFPISDPIRLAVGLLASLCGVVFTIVTLSLEANLRYHSRRLAGRPTGRRPSRKPRTLWGVFIISGLLFVSLGAVAAYAPRPSEPSVPLEPPPSPTPIAPSQTTDSPSLDAPARASAIPAASLEDGLTPVPSPTPTISSRPNGFCENAQPPCLYLPSAGDSWDQVTLKSDFADSCRWPEIANVNRNPDGTYRMIGSLLMRDGILIPEEARAAEYNPMIRFSNGTEAAIAARQPRGEPRTLPCLHTIDEAEGATGLYYAPISLEYYGGYEKEHIKLDEWIMAANLTNGCTSAPVLLLPGTTIVIPNYP